MTAPWRLRFGEQWQGLLINWMCCGVLAELFQKELVMQQLIKDVHFQKGWSPGPAELLGEL